MAAENLPPGSEPVKRCRLCGESKALEHFHRNRSNRDGFMWRCKDCNRAVMQEYRKKYPERVKESNCRRHAKNREKRLAYTRRYYQEHAEEMKARERARQRELKDAAYAAYGGYRCTCCGETEPKFLCLDHVNNDGCKHRKIVPADRLYYWLKKNAYPPIFQVLCANCNQGKQLNGGVCPHATKERVSA